MKTVRILFDFTGYPGGVETVFRAGETPALDDDYADLLCGPAKGLAEEVETDKPAQAADDHQVSP